MSVIGKKPFINKIIDACSKEQTQQIIDLMDRLDIETPIPVSLYGPDNFISSENIGVSYVTLAMNELTRQILTGILVYVNDNKCGFFGVINNSDIIDEFEINPINKTYNKIREYLTIEELRQVCGDRVSEINDMDVAGSQATTTIIRDARTNINGRVLTSYEATLHEADPNLTGDYTYYKITKGGNDLSEEQAADYMEYMSGSRFVPTYRYEKPQNSLFTMADSSIWKPQWMASGNFKGLYLFKVSDGAGGGLPEATKAGQVLVSNEDLQFEERDAVPMAENLVSDPISNDTMYSAGPTGGLADITTGEESYLREVKGYSIVWNQLLPSSGSVVLNSQHIYVRVKKSDGSLTLMKNSSSTVSAGTYSALYDLTLMFGGNDNIPFNLEQYAEYPANGTMPTQTYNPEYGFARLFADVDLINAPYDAGTIKNVKTTKLTETGKNLWDASTMEETGLHLLAGYRYEIYHVSSSQTTSVSASYDNGNTWTGTLACVRYQRADGKYIWTLLPTRNCLIKSGSAQIVYVGFVHSGNYCLTTGTDTYSYGCRTTETIPSYQKHEYDISGINGLNGIPDSSENHCSIYDTVDTNRIGSVDLSTLDWTDDGDGYWITNAPSDMKLPPAGDIPTETTLFLSDKGYDVSLLSDGTLTVNTGSTAPTGTLLYELAEPISTGTEPFEPIRIEVNDMGMEYFEGLDKCPVNQLSQYYENLKDKLINISVPEIKSAPFDKDAEPLETIIINGTKYKTLPLMSGVTNVGPYSIAIGYHLSSGYGYANANYSIAIGYGASSSGDNAIAMGNNAIARSSVGSICIGYNSETYGSGAIAIGRGAKCGTGSFTFVSANYAVAIGENTANAIPYTVTFDGTTSDFQRTLVMFNPNKIFFRRALNVGTTTSMNTLEKYTKGQYLNEYICNNALTLQDGKYYVSYTNADNYKTFTSNVISGTATDITSTITGVHITLKLSTDVVVGIDLLPYDTANSKHFTGYGIASDTPTFVSAYIDSDGTVVINPPGGVTVVEATYNIK